MNTKTIVIHGCEFIQHHTGHPFYRPVKCVAPNGRTYKTRSSAIRHFFNPKGGK